MIQRFNNISQWAAAEVLRAETPEIRVKVVELLIEISQVRHYDIITDQLKMDMISG